MNDRIKELERQAEKFVMGIPASLDINEYTSVFNEKFAELIVWECSKVIVNGGQRKGAFGNEDLRPHEIATMIEEHFGVEE
jgi:hypothetical protein